MWFSKWIAFVNGFLIDAVGEPRRIFHIQIVIYTLRFSVLFGCCFRARVVHNRWIWTIILCMPTKWWFCFFHENLHASLYLCIYVCNTSKYDLRGPYDFMLQFFSVSLLIPIDVACIFGVVKNIWSKCKSIFHAIFFHSIPDLSEAISSVILNPNWVYGAPLLPPLFYCSNKRTFQSKINFCFLSFFFSVRQRKPHFMFPFVALKIFTLVALALSTVVSFLYISMSTGDYSHGIWISFAIGTGLIH